MDNLDSTRTDLERLRNQQVLEDIGLGKGNTMATSDGVLRTELKRSMKRRRHRLSESDKRFWRLMVLPAVVAIVAVVLFVLV